MAKRAGSGSTQGWTRWRIAGWGLAVLLLLLPLIAGAPWTVSDYVVAAIVFGGIGLLFELAVRASNNLAYRAAAAVALVATFLTIWVNFAVGMIGEPANPLNLLFAGVLAIACVGAIFAGLRAEGMARAMAAAAVAQLLASLAGLNADPRGAMLAAVLTLIWLLSAWLFQRASGRDGAIPPEIAPTH